MATAVNLEHLQGLEATFFNAVTIDLHVGWGETDGYSIGSNALASATFANHDDLQTIRRCRPPSPGTLTICRLEDPRLQRPDIDRDPNAEALGTSTTSSQLGASTPDIGLQQHRHRDHSGSQNIADNAYDSGSARRRPRNHPDHGPLHRGGSE